MLFGKGNDLGAYTPQKSMQRRSGVSMPPSGQYHCSFKRHGGPNDGPICAECLLQEWLMSGFLPQDRYQR